MRSRSFTRGLVAIQVEAPSSFIATPGTSGDYSRLVFADAGMLRNVDRFREPLGIHRTTFQPIYVSFNAVMFPQKP